MKKKIIAMCAAGLSLFMAQPALAADQLLAFPGAEGFGRFATGGRGGEIYHVTNLNDSGTGSLRDAVSMSNRIIVFDVSGVINLKSTLVFKNNLTILGQTAPGEGVQVYGNRVSFSGADGIIVRYLRVRMGKDGDSGKDAAGVANGGNMIFDHMSVLWGQDECFSISWDNKGSKPHDITIQNSIIGQGLQSHSCGGLIQTDGGVTLFRNLYIENKTRNPKVKGVNQYINNVLYNWGNGGAYIMGGDSSGDSWAEISDNYFVKGPWDGATAPFIRGNENFKFYGEGNYYDDNKDGSLNGTVYEGTGGAVQVSSLAALNSPMEFPSITARQKADEAVEWVLKYGGASLPARDEVDQYLIDELASFGKLGTTNGISTEKTLPHGGTGVLSGGTKPLDTDGDGIPDDWEKANGLNPNDASDAAKIADNGYANIENYANSLTSAYPYIKMPISLAASDITKFEATLTWNNNGNTEYGYIIEISTDGSNYIEKGSTKAGDTKYIMTELEPVTKYWVRIRATDGEGLVSDYSTPITFSTIGDPTVPAASVNPTPGNGKNVGIAGGLKLKWENNVNTYAGPLSYSVYFGESTETLEEIAKNLSVTELDISDSVEKGITYYWRVDATNTEGTTQGDVWSFTTTAAGILFQADFNTLPEEFGAKYGSIEANTDIIKAANTTATFNGMVIGTGSNSIRIVSLKDSNNLGGYTTDDEGASSRAIQFYTTSTGGYVETPEITGPCTLTIYFGNPDASSKTVKVITKADGQETSENFSLAAAKKMFKYTTTYLASEPVKFRVDANGKKININDIIVERFVAPDPTDPLIINSGETEYEISYNDGSETIAFSEYLVLNSDMVKISGANKFEEIDLSVSGQSLIFDHKSLDANTEYILTFPEGALTNYDGSKSFVGDIKFTTCDFYRIKIEGETHYGKAATNLPLNFAPFNTYSQFITVSGTPQSQANDYPHWVQTASGSISADNVKFTAVNSNNKIMAYWEGIASHVYIEAELASGSTGELLIQETRNPDIPSGSNNPTWRTIRVLHTEDFPFKGEFELNNDARFVKITPQSVSGTIQINSVRISDDDGYYGSDFSGISEVIDENMSINVENGVITIKGISSDSTVSIYDITGRLVASGKGESTFNLASGLYIVCVSDMKPVKLAIR